MTSFYLDSSAAVKLIVEESGSGALRRWIAAEDPDFVSSDLLRVEVLRATRRHSPEAVAAAREVLQAVTLLPLTADLCQDAGMVDPAVLRSLDALHLAAALSLGDDLTAVITYDEGLAQGCRAYGLAVVAP